MTQTQTKRARLLAEVQAQGFDQSVTSLVFSKGSGHNGEAPTVAEVLDCLASDAAGIENARDFEDWCSEYGYDTDSRKNARAYRACKRQAIALNRIMGNDGLYERLLFHTERE
jgi:hypothetical protein